MSTTKKITVWASLIVAVVMAWAQCDYEQGNAPDCPSPEYCTVYTF